MPTINPASDRTLQKRYCLTAGNGSERCCNGPVGPAGPAGSAGATGAPGIVDISGVLGDILYSNGTGGITLSYRLTYDVLNDRLAIGEGQASTRKSQSGASQVAIGAGAGGAGTSSNYVIAVGYNAGYTQSANSTIAIGNSAGYSQTATGVLAVGANAGLSQTSSGAIAIGSNAGNAQGGQDVIAIGTNAGAAQPNAGSIAIGPNSGARGLAAIAIGSAAGQIAQGTNTIAIGSQAGTSGQGFGAIAIGYDAGAFNQYSDAVALGAQAGTNNQRTDAIAIGRSAGNNSQQVGAIAIGRDSGNTDQQTLAIAIGPAAGQTDQQTQAVAIGVNAGKFSQQSNAIAIGYEAGLYSQANNAIAIGAYAGMTHTASSIILNAGGTGGATVDFGLAGFFVNPVRSVDISANATGYQSISYNAGTNEIVYNPVPAFKGYVAGSIECNTSSITVTSTAAPVPFTFVKRTVGGVGITGTPLDRITLPVVGLYEITSILQCGLTGASTNSIISAWHSLNGATGTTGQMETGVRSLYVTDSSGSILTTNIIFQTTSTSDYAQLTVTATPDASLLTKGGSFGTVESTSPAVFTTVKLIG